MDLDNLSDTELRQQLTALGQSVGPLTTSTRTLYIKKLKNLLRMQGDAPINPPTPPARRSPKSSVEEHTGGVSHNAQLFGDEKPSTQHRGKGITSGSPKARRNKRPARGAPNALRSKKVLSGSPKAKAVKRSPQPISSLTLKSFDDGSPQYSLNEPPIRMDYRGPTSTRKRRLVNRVAKANQDQGLCTTNTIPQIPLSQIDDLDGTPLGEGTFGRVVKCQYFDNHDLQWKDVAIKYASPAYRSALVREAKIFYTYLNHKNCIKFFGLYSCPLNGTGIVMELMDCSLAWLISKQFIKYEVDHAISWLYQLSDAMSFFHSKEQVHRDLKLQNLLLCNGYHTLKVCDFGTYTTLHESMTMEKGTPITMAPEVIRAFKHYDEKCDIYSFGIIMWQIIARRLSPYQGDRCYVVFNVARNILRPPELSCDPLLSRFYKACWNDDPDVRPNSEQVKQYLAVLKKAFPSGNRDLIDTSTNEPAVIPQPKLVTPFKPQHRRARSDPLIPYNRRSSSLNANIVQAGKMEEVCPNPETANVGDVEHTQNENVEHDPPLGFLRRYIDRRRDPWDPQLPNPLLFVQRLFATMEW